MNDKRTKKFDPLKDRKDLFEITGNPNAPLAMVAWAAWPACAARPSPWLRPRG